MAHATDQSVLGDFNNAGYDYFGTRSRFFRRDGKFFVETDGPNGMPATFQIKYTFGIYPLQQYLIEFPDGRIQALSIAWDSRPKKQGGQRWFHLYPKEKIGHNDILYWTKLNQNWNYMCAECHSTDVHKNYDSATNRFATTWSEISVGCEACHGPGSGHIAWAQAQKDADSSNQDPTMGLVVHFDERRGISWRQDPKTGMPERSKPAAALRKEVETCGRCHARRSEFSEDWMPGQWLSDTHEVSLLDRTTFSADGQMRDNEETYNYAAFKQSKMFAKGVTCSDCHDPHSAKLRAPGNSVCLQCHTAVKYQTASHSHHDASPSVTCISCHMPVRSYMVVDRRHDHSFRIPRPDLSVTLGTPNACNDCHRGKSAQWAATAIKRWFGPHREGFQNYAAAFHAAWTDQPNAGKLLSAVASNSKTSAFVRASAFNALNAYVSQVDVQLARNGLSDPNPMVRVGILDMLEGVPANLIWSLVSPLLSDPVRGVRIKAVSILASMPTANQPATDRGRFERAVREFVAAQQLNADRPEARSALGNFYAQRGLPVKAEEEFKAALRLSPQYAVAAVNLADLYRAVGRDSDGLDVLRTALVASPRDAALHYALGLALVRLKKVDEALKELQRAAALAPDQSQYAYAYAVGLKSNGDAIDAIAVLKQNLIRHPADRNTLIALISFYRELGNKDAATDYARRLVNAFPSDKQAAKILNEVQRPAQP
ncbi:MAG: tetratricopeptide repeat protein [Pseudolabrys sp.]